MPIQTGPTRVCGSCEEGTGYITAYGYNLPTVGYALALAGEPCTGCVVARLHGEPVCTVCGEEVSDDDISMVHPDQP